MCYNLSRNTKKISIRTAKKEDINQIWELGKNVDAFETSEDTATFCPKSILKNCINKNDVLILVAESKGDIIGFSLLNINDSLRKGEIENIFILEQFRRQGYGKDLLKRSIQEFKKRKIEDICALSNSVSFFANFGFSKGKQFHWMELALSKRFKK